MIDDVEKLRSEIKAMPDIAIGYLIETLGGEVREIDERIQKAETDDEKALLRATKGPRETRIRLLREEEKRRLSQTVLGQLFLEAKAEGEFK